MVNICITLATRIQPDSFQYYLLKGPFFCVSFPPVLG